LLGFSAHAVVIGAYNEENVISPKLCELIDSVDKQCLVLVDGNAVDKTLGLVNDWGRVA
jgi:glycosyltransferase involved in cell wall biosynthesis